MTDPQERLLIAVSYAVLALLRSKVGYVAQHSAAELEQAAAAVQLSSKKHATTVDFEDMPA